MRPLGVFLPLEQTHPHTSGLPELHVVTDHDLAAATGAREWAGPTVPLGHIVQTGYVPTEDVICHAPFGHQLLPAAITWFVAGHERRFAP